MSLIHHSLFSFNLKHVHPIIKKVDQKYYDYYFCRKNKPASSFGFPFNSSIIKIDKQILIKSLLSIPRSKTSTSVEISKNKNNSFTIKKSLSKQIQKNLKQETETDNNNINNSDNEYKPKKIFVPKSYNDKLNNNNNENNIDENIKNINFNSISNNKTNKKISNRNMKKIINEEEEKKISLRLKKNFDNYYTDEEEKNFFITYKNRKNLNFFNFNRSAINLMDIRREEDKNNKNSNPNYNTRYYNNIINNYNRYLSFLPKSRKGSITPIKNQKNKSEDDEDLNENEKYGKKIKIKINNKKLYIKIKSTKRSSDVSKNYYIDKNNNIVEKVDNSCQSVASEGIRNKLRGLKKSKSLNSLKNRISEQNILKQKYLNFIENKSFVLRANFIMNHLQETRGDKQKLRALYNPKDI